jgi:hypothetical protein
MTTIKALQSGFNPKNFSSDCHLDNDNHEAAMSYYNDICIESTEHVKDESFDFSGHVFVLELTKKAKAKKHLRSTFELFASFFDICSSFISCMNSKNKGAKNFLKQKYNTLLNKIRNCIRPDSQLNNLMFVDNQFRFFKPKEPTIKTKTNILTLEPIEEPVVVRLSNGRISFDDCEEATRYLLIALSNATFKDLVEEPHDPKKWGCCNRNTKQNSIGKTQFSINIPVNHTMSDGRASTKTSFLNTRDSKLINILFDGKHPTKAKREILDSGHPTDVFDRFISFEKAVEKKIHQLIDTKFSDDSFKYMTISCVRIEPKCEHSRIVLKNRDDQQSKLYVCECEMQLCMGTCCGIYHGETPCGTSSDEASEIFISETTNPCPGCNTRTFRFEGCNHMTCKMCCVEFCNICLQEYEKDSRGMYMVTEHHRNFGGADGGGGRCRQFS